jgi:hypothetical protein
MEQIIWIITIILRFIHVKYAAGYMKLHILINKQVMFLYSGLAVLELLRSNNLFIILFIYIIFFWFNKVNLRQSITYKDTLLYTVKQSNSGHFSMLCFNLKKDVLVYKAGICTVHLMVIPTFEWMHKRIILDFFASDFHF